MSEQRIFTARQVAAFASRYALAMMMGQQTAYAGSRKYYSILGYPQEITIEDYWQRYDRQDIASRVVDLPAIDTWRNPPMVSEDGNDETPFAQAWQELVRAKRLWGYLTRADRLSGVGRFGILLLGLRDGGDLEKPARKLANADGLLYLRPFSEKRVAIKTFEEDAKSPRYGLPLLYEVELGEGTDKTLVHFTRILHLAEGKLSSEVYGTPRLKRVFNRLDDLIKQVGGGSEAAWLNMRHGLHIHPAEGYTMDNISATDLEAEIEHYMHDIMRVFQMEGVDVDTVADSEVVDVSPMFDITLSLIAAASGIPQRVLIGSAQGELAAAKEDMRQWAGEIATRQKTYAEPEIFRPFVDMLIGLGILPEVESYDIGTQNDDGEWEWPPLAQQTAEEEATIQETRANAVARVAAVSAYPLTDGETRQMLGQPKERPEDEPAPEPPKLLPPGQEPALDAVDVVMNNVRSGSVDPDKAFAFAMMTFEDLRGNGHG